MQPDDELPSIPRHRILRTIGEGGMGVVYEAEQLEPVRRRVALKVLKMGMDTKAFIGRFHAERQALAVMEHPGIARVYDAGSTADGRPFYTMEFVPGPPLTEFCDTQRLDTRGRIELMIQVCDAVDHAHGKGIIHRDLKPSNVLVTLRGDRAVPIIIDFGIAKALIGRLSDYTYATQLHQPIGTPAYMSPEQWEAGHLDVDVRTDIYSLGVILYELLVGVLPYDPEILRRAGPGASAVVRETPPPTPSTRLNSLGQNALPFATLRRTDPGTLTRQLRGDLDWITLKALDPDRTRRYESAGAMLADLRRHLRAEPVLARPPDFWYRTRRFVRRRRLELAAASAAGLILVLSVYIALSIRERRRDGYARAAFNDLRNLVVAEEVYYATHNRYTGSIADLAYEPSPGVKVEMFEAADEAWTAVATHEKLPGMRCAIAIGARTPLAGEGEPVCTR